MERKIFHGVVTPEDVAHALIGEFNQGNLHAKAMAQNGGVIVQVGTSPYARSGGQTAITISIQKHEDGIIVDIGEQAWLGVAASLGASAFSALRNPLSLLGRLDDIAQDIENLQLAERIWKLIEKTAQAKGSARELSDRLKRAACAYCGSANPVGEPNCIACGAPLGAVQPDTCKNCGYVVNKKDKTCPNCKAALE